MPRRREPPRLYLRRARADRGATWVIRDGAREVGTGCGASDIEGAKRALESYLAQSYRPPSGSNRPDEILISEALLVYMREKAPTLLHPQQIKDSANPLLQWWGTKTLADIKGQSCRDYAAWRGKAPSAGRDLRTLKAAVNYYHKEYGPLTAVPAFTMPETPPPRDRWLTRSEAAKLLWACRPALSRHLARFILIGLYSGTRSKAMLKLSWLPATDGGFIDLEAGVVRRRSRSQRITNKRQPPVRIHARLLPWLKRWQKADMAAGIVHVIHFQGGRISRVSRSWRQARTRAGLAADVIPHTLRHTAATWLMQRDVPLWEAAGYLGMTPETLQHVYGHHSPSHQSKAAGFSGA